MVIADSQLLEPASGNRQSRGSLTMTQISTLFGTLAFAVSFAGSWIPSLWGDEAASVMSAERPLSTLFPMLQHVDAVHGTYYLLLHFWIDLFGASPLSVRFPSAVITGIACGGTIVLANILFSRRIAVITGIVCVLLPRFTYMGSEARSYALSAAVAVWLTVLFVMLVATRSRRASLWVLYGVGVAVGIYVFLYLALLLLVHGAYFLVVRREERQWRRWFRATVFGVVLAGPVIGFGIAERNQIAFLAHRSPATFSTVLVGQWFDTVWLASLCWGLIVFGCVATVLALRKRSTLTAGRTFHVQNTNPRGMVFILVWCILPTTLLLAANAVVLPSYSNRYLSFCAPAVAILLAIGVAALPRFWMQVAALLAFVALAIPGYIAERTEFGKPGGSDWAVVSAIIAQKAMPGDAIVFDNGVKPSWRPRLAMHLYPADYTAVDDIALKTPYERTADLWDEVYPIQDITDRLVGISRVWSLETTVSDSTSVTSDLHVLERNGFTVEQVIPVHRTIIYELVRSRS
ncbi:MAG: glycosyltransferase family 39 protein [Terrimesophilobacter sp.]